jgi:hypothetical protein
VHAKQVANLLEKHRSHLVEQLGGRDQVNEKLLDKSRGRGKGVAEELKRLKNALPEQDITRRRLHAYVTQPELTAKDIERDITSVPITRSNSPPVASASDSPKSSPTRASSPPGAALPGAARAAIDDPQHVRVGAG